MKNLFGMHHSTGASGWPQEMKRDMVEVQRSVMLNMDAPHHTRLRKIISRGFTPRAVGRLQDELNERAQRIAKAAAAEGSGDFVEQVACELPLQAIAGLLGIPQEDREKLFRWSNEMTGNDDPDYADVDAKASTANIKVDGAKAATEVVEAPAGILALLKDVVIVEDIATAKKFGGRIAEVAARFAA